MPATSEILDNVVTIAEMMSSRSAVAPDVPYLELAKCIRVLRPEPEIVRRIFLPKSPPGPPGRQDRRTPCTGLPPEEPGARPPILPVRPFGSVCGRK
jgi:hypothetical protein